MPRKKEPFLYMLAAVFLSLSCSLSNPGEKSTSPSPAASDVESDLPLAGTAEYLRELDSLGFGQYLEASDERRTKTSEYGWDVYHYDTSDCRCLLGDAYILAARKGTQSTKTVFWMSGGGACYPGYDRCTKTAWIDLPRLGSRLASSDPSNPVAGWNFIYVPYCDGSAHLGDSSADYDEDGTDDHWHWGLKNTTAAVRLMQELFPESEEILVAGCSAGGYGTIGTTPIVRLQFPQSEIYVLNESGLGLMNPEIRSTYELAFRTWNVNGLFPPDCPQCNTQYIYMYSWQLSRDPHLKVGVYSSYQDAVFAENWDMDPEKYQSLLLEMSGEVSRSHPLTFHRYFIEGSGHCVQNYSYEVNGVSIREWIRYMLEGDPRWVDVLE